jgi:hypothetical protein
MAEEGEINETRRAKAEYSFRTTELRLPSGAEFIPSAEFAATGKVLREFPKNHRLRDDCNVNRFM